MTALSYLAQSFPWGAVGLLMGYLLGRGVQDVVAEVANPEGTMADKQRRSIRKWFSYDRIIGVVVFVLAVATVVQGYVSSESTRRIADCTRGYSNGFADALEARSSAQSAAQNALDQWMSTLGDLMTKVSPDPAAAREQFRVATADYLKLRAEAKKQQAEPPYPPPPRAVCK